MKILDLKSSNPVLLSTIFEALKDALESDERCPLTKPIVVFADRNGVKAYVHREARSVAEVEGQLFGAADEPV